MFTPFPLAKELASGVSRGLAATDLFVFSTENLVASLLLARSLVVWARDMVTTTLLLDEERLGSDTTLSACGDTDKRIAHAIRAKDDVDIDETSHFYAKECEEHDHDYDSCDGVVSGQIRTEYRGMLMAWSSRYTSAILKLLHCGILSITTSLEQG